MNVEKILEEFDEVVEKLKIKIIYYQSENTNLRNRINELKKYVKEK